MTSRTSILQPTTISDLASRLRDAVDVGRAAFGDDPRWSDVEAELCAVAVTGHRDATEAMLRALAATRARSR